MKTEARPVPQPDDFVQDPAHDWEMDEEHSDACIRRMYAQAGVSGYERYLRDCLTDKDLGKEPRWRCIKCDSPMRVSVVPIPGEGRVDRHHVCERCGCTVAK